MQESFLKKNQQQIMSLPLFLLAFGCGVNENSLMLLALFIHLLLSYIYKEPIVGGLWHSKIYKQSWLFIGIFIGTMLFAWCFNNGSLKEISRYFSRILPFLLIGIIASNENKKTVKILWLGIVCGLAFLCGQTFNNFKFIDGRLCGSFAMPIGLASVLVTLLPFTFWGFTKCYAKNKIIGLLGLIISMCGLYLLLRTASRGAFLTFSIAILLYLLFLIFFKEWKKVSLSLLCVLIIAGSYSFMNFNRLQERMENDVHKDGRVYLYQVAATIFQEHPFVGIGVKKWGDVYRNRFQLPNREKNMESPHNIFIQSVNESGLIGLGGFIVLLGFQFRKLLEAVWNAKIRKQQNLRWAVGVLLCFIAIVINGLFDYAFFGRYVMGLFWFYWGIGTYVMQEETGEKADA